ncbi:hypothetical protein [Natranaeroarchaeum aerophilus]|uniref:Uncharacterized protein n=1 Tax=Natranaeroarchaeum aerophilus TaxID=2917711 RepID=A0AAE3FQ58_9EURY|nr:hypothetical protein [Natranaeroarchaeum aerophilus]MCL9813126.1 hypothetical protein [Natranaeroarchaeum aerophilus]
MPIKSSGEAVLEKTIEWDGGMSWIAHPEEGMERASHAVVVNEGVWLVDPVDAERLDDAIAEYGPVAGVVVLLDRHKRDSAAIARRHDVPVYVHESMDDVAGELDADIERFGDTLPGTPFSVIPVVDNRFWKEVALYDADSGTLVVAESFGRASYFLTADERIGVHPMRRGTPPRDAFENVAAERILVGHGTPLLENATRAMRDALAGSRKRMPRLYLSAARSLLPF